MLDRFRALVRTLRGRRHLDGDMDAELRFHIEEYKRDLIRHGVAPEEASRRAHTDFGNIATAKEDCRSATPLAWFDEFARNLQYGARQLRHSPGFTTAAVLTLGLCIGVNTAVFSVIDAVMLRSAPYPEPERLADVIREYRRKDGGELSRTANQDGAAWEALKDGRSYRAAVAGSVGGVNLAIGDRAVYVRRQRIGAGYFGVLGVNFPLGREFTDAEDRKGGPAVTVLSHGLWKTVFAGDPSIVGRTIRLRGESYEVIGVTPANFRHRWVADLWTPLRASATGEGGGTNFTMVARVKPGATWGEAAAEVEARGAAAFAAKKISSNVAARLTLEHFAREHAAALRQRLLILAAGVAVILLIGCVNIASLLLARGAARRREMGTRIALGSGAGSLIRQLASESLVLGLLGGAAGIALAYAAIWSLETVVARYGVWQEIRLDARVLGATALLSIAVSFFFGLVPALQAARVDVREALLEGGSRSVAGGRSRWLRRALVLAEVSLSLVLVVGAGLLVRTLLHLENLSPGFDARNVTVASASLDDDRYKNHASVDRLFRETLTAIRQVPGVHSAAVALHVPYQRWLNGGVRIRRSADTTAAFAGTSMNYVTPEYFDTLRIPLRAGRAFTEQDTASSEPVAIVNEDFVRQLLRGADPLGMTVINEGTERRIVGVVANVQQKPGLRRDGGPIAPEAAFYIPAPQFPEAGFAMVHTWFPTNWVIRSSTASGAAITHAIAGVDPMLPVAEVRSIVDERNGSLQMQRVNAGLIGALAALAVLLALVGVYGIVAQSVVERRHEFGIRMALGSSRAKTLWIAVRHGLIMCTAGAALGAGLAGAGVRVLKGLLYGVQPIDPATFAAGILGVIAVGAVASLLPALRVIRVDASAVLRHD